MKRVSQMISFLMSVFFSLITSAFAEVPPPCQNNPQSEECINELSNAILFKRSQVIEAYVKEFGSDVFFVPKLGHFRISLFEYASKFSKDPSIAQGLFREYKKKNPRDTTFYGSLLDNTHLVGIKEVKSYLHILRDVFPRSGDDEVAGLVASLGSPWEDKNFPDRYIFELESMAQRFKEDEEFFGRKIPEDILLEFERTKDLLKEYSAFPEKACGNQDLSALEEFEKKFGRVDFVHGSELFECTLKKKNWKLGLDLLKSGRYSPEYLQKHFDSLMKDPEADSFLVLEMWKKQFENGQTPKVFKAGKPILLKEGEFLFQKDLLELVNCTSQKSGAVSELELSIHSVLGKYAHELVLKSLKSRDASERLALVKELKDLINMGIQIEGSPLQDIALAGDYELLDMLLRNGVGAYSLAPIAGHGRSLLPALKLAKAENINFLLQYVKHQSNYLEISELEMLHENIGKEKLQGPQVKLLQKELRFIILQRKYE